MDWLNILAVFLNGFFVFLIVQVLKTVVMPFLKTQYPWVLPIIATLAGPAVTMATNYLSALIGHPIDFSEIVGVLTGAVTATIYAASRQAYKKRL